MRKTDAGNTFHNFFCPTCGTSLYFFSSRDRNRVGVAVGAFADPAFPIRLLNPSGPSSGDASANGGNAAGFPCALQLH